MSDDPSNQNILESIFLFPNETIGTFLYKGVESLYNTKDEAYHIFIGAIIIISTFFILTRALGAVVGTSKLAYRLFILLPLLLIWGAVNYKNPYKIVTRYPRISLAYNIIFLFLVGTFFSFKNLFYPTSGNNEGNGIDNPVSLLHKLCISFVFLLFILGIVLMIVWSFTNVTLLHKVLEHSLILLLILGATSIGYIIIKKHYFTDPKDKYNTSLFEKILFYFPCLLIELIDYAKKQNNMTTPTVWILLAIELVLVAFYLNRPRVVNYYTTKGAIVLLKDPVYLNNRHTLGNFENLHKKKKHSHKKNKFPFSYEYAISGWFYINPQPPNTSIAYTEYTEIFNYANKPIIEYSGADNKIRVRTDVGKNNMQTAYLSKDVEYQKWTNFVINYDGANMDVFINGELVGSQQNIAPHMSYEKVIAGKFSGIHGGICNVLYHEKMLTKKTIKYTYNLLKLYNPPII